MLKRIAKGCGMTLLAVLILGGGGWWYYQNNDGPNSRRGPLDRQAVTMYAAIRAGDTQSVERVLTQQPKLVYARFGADGTALHVAARYNRPEIIKLLLSWGAELSDSNGRYAATPLHWAAWWGASDAAAELIKAGASVDARATMGTPLRWAVRGAEVRQNRRADYRAVVRVLLNAGADPNGGDGQGWPVTIEQQDAGVAALLKEHGGTLTASAPQLPDSDDPTTLAQGPARE